MPCYTLYLSTQINSPTSNYVVAIDKSNLANVSWRVDFDNLFKGEQAKYKHCRVRFYLMGDSFTASTPGSTDWTNYGGYLSISLPTNYQSQTANGTILGLTYPGDSPVTTTNIHCILISTMGEVGVDILVPTGVQQMNVSLISWLTNTFITTMQNYSLLLNFELYNQE